MKPIYTLIIWIMFFAEASFTQETLKVLFIGNSYTSVNNLPSLVQNLSQSAGKKLIIDSSMPGGYTISQHLNDANTKSKINKGDWDYVIVQEQSQIPTINQYRYQESNPSFKNLKNYIQQKNPCAKIISYMTWGRRFGGQQCDPQGNYCSVNFKDFNHMQDTLQSAYRDISNQLNIQCAPVGVAWQQVLNNTSLVLHATDNSHPTIDGSYLAALTLFSSIWKLPSADLSYTAGISTSNAKYYQATSDKTLFDNPDKWNLWINHPVANFSYTINNNLFIFNNLSSSKSSDNLSYFWDFGDGTTEKTKNPSHTYASAGTYPVKLIVTDCSFSDTLIQTIKFGTNFIAALEDDPSLQFSNPVRDFLIVKIPSEKVGNVYRIYDYSGKILLEGTMDSETETIDLRSYSPGIYFFSVGQQQQKTYKLIKE